jgi:hypothetical protein
MQHQHGEDRLGLDRALEELFGWTCLLATHDRRNDY